MSGTELAYAATVRPRRSERFSQRTLTSRYQPTPRVCQITSSKGALGHLLGAAGTSRLTPYALASISSYALLSLHSYALASLYSYALASQASYALSRTRPVLTWRMVLSRSGRVDHNRSVPRWQRLACLGHVSCHMSRA
eukprot:145541-Rhodomonas_salina.2